MSIQAAFEDYKRFLVSMEAQHRKTIEEANARLEEMIAAADTTQVDVPTASAQSAWITGNDGERFLMLNEEATKQIEKLFEGFQEILQLLMRQDTK